MSVSKEKPVKEKKTYERMPHKDFPADTASPTKVREYIAWVLERGQEYSTEEAEEVARKWEKRMGHELETLSADELGSLLGSQHIRGLLFLREKAVQAEKVRQSNLSPWSSSNIGNYLFFGGIGLFVLTAMVLTKLEAIAAAGRPRTCR